MRREKFALGIMIFLVLLNSSFALNFTVKASYPEKIIAGEEGIGSLEITNYDEKSFFSFSVFGPKPEWIVFEKSLISLEKGESKTVKVHIKPGENAYEAVYKFRLKVTAQDGSVKEVAFPLKIVQTEKLRFSNISISCKNNICSPGEKVKFSVKITNLGKEKRTFKIIFLFQGKKAEHDVIVEGRSDKIVSSEFLLDKYQSPGEYKVNFEVMEAGEKIFEKTSSFMVKKIEKIEKSESEKKGIFTRDVTITLKNEGNTEKEYTISSNASNEPLTFIWHERGYKGWEGALINGKYLMKVKLKPGEKAVITYKEVFFLRILIILIIAALLIYFKFFYVWGVKIKKNLIYKPPLKEGDKISVSIEISASKSVKKIVVRDFVPPSFELVKSFETIKPIRKEKEDGIELVWKVRSLKPGEERVLHYKLKTKIGVMGSLALPKASVECEIEGKKAVKKSNTPRIKGVSE